MHVTALKPSSIHNALWLLLSSAAIAAVGYCGLPWPIKWVLAIICGFYGLTAHKFNGLLPPHQVSALYCSIAGQWSIIINDKRIAVSLLPTTAIFSWFMVLHCLTLEGERYHVLVFKDSVYSEAEYRLLRYYLLRRVGLIPKYIRIAKRLGVDIS